MPKPTPKPARSSSRPPIVPNPKVIHEVVDPRWIISALAGTLAFAILCAWIAVCALFYQGQWQLVLQPTRTVTQTPASLGLPFTEVHFGADPSGSLQLDGWYVPADATSDVLKRVVLLLHDGKGNLSDSLFDVNLLHSNQLNVLVFDYRGYGNSAGKHPTEALMEADTDTAFRYLTDIKGVPPSQIIVFGRGLAASLATTLASTHKDIPALILLHSKGDTAASIRSDSRSTMVPTRLLFTQTFPLALPLSTVPTPKLILSYPDKSLADTHLAASPKMTVELSNPNPDDLHNAIRRFLDTYLP